MAPEEDRRDPERLKAIIDSAVDRAISEGVPEAVRHTFVRLGIDTTSPEAVIEVQKDNAFLRRFRLRMDVMSARVGQVVIGVIVAGLAAALWAGFKIKVGQ